MKMKGRTEIADADYTLYIDYDYYYESGDYYQPPTERIEIEKVEIHDMDFSKDITEFYFDYVTTNDIEEKCLEDARDKYNEN
tara:strand:- start:262 stop:507 length:246 start_codon:yes stop_codon:yes gene_type:complete